MKELALAQGTLRYLDEGDGPPIVFVHGLLVDHRLWRPVIDRLRGQHRCLAPAWPLGSHEMPMAPDADLSPAGVAALVADFLAALDLEDVTLVGNDSGGVISQLVAADHGERVGRLVLTNCDALEVFPPPGFGYLRWLPRIPGAMTATALVLSRSAWARRRPQAYGALTAEPLPDDLVADWVRPAARDRRIRRDTGKFVAGASPRVTLSVAKRLRRFAGPTLLLWGASDQFFPLALADRLRPCFADAALEPIEGGRTFVPLDRPAAVAAGIARLVAAPVSGSRSHAIPG
jgi:pimeloyl-ACP methyl ester carboxylesterase